MKYNDYQNSRNLSWDILLDTKVKKLSIKIIPLCRKLGIDVFTYKQMAPTVALIKQARPNKTFDGYCKYIDGKPAILYDENMSTDRIRFTIAHELGHLMLGHVPPENDLVMFRDDQYPTPPEDQAANVFARDLLAPACVLWGVGVQTPEDIHKLTGLSMEASSIRMERMQLLYNRDELFRKTRGHGCFLLDDRERELFERFIPFIRSHRLK